MKAKRASTFFIGLDVFTYDLCGFLYKYMPKMRIPEVIHFSGHPQIAGGVS
jgi:hypothetical protein